MRFSPEPDPPPEAAWSPASMSKRAARRLIQRAWVLTGRDRSVRQRIRHARLVTHWALTDWGLEWTAVIDRGTLRFERQPARRPQVAFSWPSAEEFFRSVQAGSDDPRLATEGEPEARRVAEFVRRAFLETLRKVMQYPYDQDGRRLA
jgi:hypothetical protein